MNDREVSIAIVCFTLGFSLAMLVVLVLNFL